MNRKLQNKLRLQASVVNDITKISHDVLNTSQNQAELADRLSEQVGKFKVEI